MIFIHSSCVKAKEESLRRLPKKILQVTDPTKKTMSTYFMTSSYDSAAVQWPVKKSRKAIDLKQSGYFYNPQGCWSYSSVLTSQFFPMPYEYTPWVKLRGSSFELSCGWKPRARLFKWKLLSSTCTFSCLPMMPYNVVTFYNFLWKKPKLLYCEFLNERYWAFCSCGTVYNILQGGSKF